MAVDYDNEEVEARLQIHWNNLLRIRHHIFMKK
ncbi:hypothetical protein Gotri_011182 [Gossypium trilobum]|uniref:Uncharacterized protein n=1 Tax=Gossypium trilobum TaxID=34281 RepID=A0A7J9ESV5_9ROSI|nr:hypothetical protein [Gossypium trilobum]